MRLINADDLIKAFEALALMSGEYQESFTNVDGNRSMEIKCAEDIINNAKTIDAEPVKHAHWHVIDADSEGDEAFCHYWATLKCSRCGYERETEDGYIPDYCEGCGAKMDEEKENNRE